MGGLLSGRGSSKQSMEHVANGDVTTNDMTKISTQHERLVLKLKCAILVLMTCSVICFSPEYIEQSWYLPEQRSAFKAPKENLRVEGRREPPLEIQRERRTSKEVCRGEQLQATVVRQTSYKHTAFEKVYRSRALLSQTPHLFTHEIDFIFPILLLLQSKSGSTKSRIAFFEEL